MANDGRKQSTFPPASLPLAGDEQIDLIQNGRNRRTGLSNLPASAGTFELVRTRKRPVDATHPAFGLSPTASAADNGAALADAFAYLDGKPGAVYVPPPEIDTPYSYDTTIPVGQGQALVGECFGSHSGAYGSHLDYTGDGTGLTFDTNSVLRDFILSSASGSIGIKNILGASRSFCERVKLSGFNLALQLEQLWIATFDILISDAMVAGITIQGEHVNAVSFQRGAVETCPKGVVITDGPHTGLTFAPGFVIEGNGTHGIHCTGVADGLDVGSYFEDNGTFDIYLDNPGMRAPWLHPKCLVTPTSVVVNAAKKAMIDHGFYSPAGVTPKAIKLNAGAVDCVVGPNYFATGFFVPSTDDLGSRTAWQDNGQTDNGTDGGSYLPGIIRARSTQVPSPVYAGVGAGSGPPPLTLVAGSTETRGTIRFGTGTGPSASILMQFQMAAAWPSRPFVRFTAKNKATQDLGLYYTSDTNAAFYIWCANAPAASQAGTTYEFDYEITA